MRRTAILLASFAMLLTLGAAAQESRSEVSLQGTGFFTKDTHGQVIRLAEEHERFLRYGSALSLAQINLPIAISKARGLNPCPWRGRDPTQLGVARR